jgi:hypothetical protein
MTDWASTSACATAHTTAADAAARYDGSESGRLPAPSRMPLTTSPPQRTQSSGRRKVTQQATQSKVSTERGAAHLEGHAELGGVALLHTRQELVHQILHALQHGHGLLLLRLLSRHVCARYHATHWDDPSVRAAASARHRSESRAAHARWSGAHNADCRARRRGGP